MCLSVLGFFICLAVVVFFLPKKVKIPNAPLPWMLLNPHQRTLPGLLMFTRASWQKTPMYLWVGM